MISATKYLFMFLFKVLIIYSCPILCDFTDCSLCPWNSPGKNTGVGCHFLLQGIFPTQGSNPCLQLGRQILYHCTTQEAQQVSDHFALKLGQDCNSSEGHRLDEDSGHSREMGFQKGEQQASSRESPTDGEDGKCGPTQDLITKLLASLDLSPICSKARRMRRWYQGHICVAPEDPERMVVSGPVLVSWEPAQPVGQNAETGNMTRLPALAESAWRSGKAGWPELSPRWGGMCGCGESSLTSNLSPQLPASHLPWPALEMRHNSRKTSRRQRQ